MKKQYFTLEAKIKMGQNVLAKEIPPKFNNLVNFFLYFNLFHINLIHGVPNFHKVFNAQLNVGFIDTVEKVQRSDIETSTYFITWYDTFSMNI